MNAREIVDKHALGIASAMAVTQEAGSTEDVYKIFYGSLVRIADLAFEEAARLHESVETWCDHESEQRAGAGAMGADIRYRDTIRQLKSEP